MKFIEWNQDIVASYHRMYIPVTVISAREKEIRNWCRKNCFGNIIVAGEHNHWFFELDEDAVAFKIRWIEK